jgi:hypothetical protein
MRLLRLGLFAANVKKYVAGLPSLGIFVRTAGRSFAVPIVAESEDMTGRSYYAINAGIRRGMRKSIGRRKFVLSARRVIR